MPEETYRLSETLCRNCGMQEDQCVGEVASTSHPCCDRCDHTCPECDHLRARVKELEGVAEQSRTTLWRVMWHLVSLEDLDEAGVRIIKTHIGEYAVYTLPDREDAPPAERRWFRSRAEAIADYWLRNHERNVTGPAVGAITFPTTGQEEASNV